MSLRTRLLLAFAAVVLIPIALLAFGLREEMSRRLSAEYQVRVDVVIDTIRDDLARDSTAIADRLASLQAALLTDNRFRVAAAAGAESEREYLLDYAGAAMRLTGLSMLQIQDHTGRILSSGHFRNEHGRVDAGLAAALSKTPGVAFVAARAPDREFLALAKATAFQMSGQTFTIVGGVTVDEAFLAQLARERELAVSFHYQGRELSATPTRVGSDGDSALGELQIPVIRSSANGVEAVSGRLEVTQSLAPLTLLLQSADAWFLLTAGGAILTALVLAVWVSSRISRPLSALADKTAVLDLDRLDVEFDAGTDEVGRLSRLLGDLAARLRTSTARIREAERRATVGDMARQVNHDIKNGLIPLRNVMRHLAHLEREEPAALAKVFGERRPTIDSSLAYLETLAASYQRLSPPLDRRECDVNALILDVAAVARAHPRVTIETNLKSVPPVVGDPVAFRRILENLIANAVDSLGEQPGRIDLSTGMALGEGERHLVQVSVTDSGRGMSAEEAKRIFDDFYTTKEGGTGLGLSIVRRLVMDLHGTIAVESTPGKGTRISIDIPAGRSRRAT